MYSRPSIVTLFELETLALHRSTTLCAGSILGLCGDLGAGKTTLTRLLVKALGGEANLVESPTFTYMNQYDAKYPIFHFDIYSLKTAKDFYALGLDEFLFQEGISIIEWAEKIEKKLPDTTLFITLEQVAKEKRKVTFHRKGNVA